MGEERRDAVRRAHKILSSPRTLDNARAVPETIQIAEDELWRVDDVMRFAERLQEIRKDLLRVLDDMDAY